MKNLIIFLALALVAFGLTNTTLAASGVLWRPNNFVPTSRLALVPLDENPGFFRVAGLAGVPAMHVAPGAIHHVVFLDKVENTSQTLLPNGRAAYSVVYDVQANTFIALAVKTNAFCSGGCLLTNGTILSLGGNGPLADVDPTVGDGFTGIRYYDPKGPQIWSEPGNKLSSPRWYPSVLVLDNGKILVCSGSKNGLDPTVAANNNPTCEILDANGIPTRGSLEVSLLVKTQPYHMYPFVHQLPENGLIFMFAGKSADLLDPYASETLMHLDDMPGLSRTYPNTGSSAMLMLSYRTNYTATILICGGGAYQDITSPTDHSCGYITPNAENPRWNMEAMPEGRTMLDMIVLAEGTILLVNGANQGAEGFGLATKPVTYALYYSFAKDRGYRFTKGATSSIPRLYHSVAIQLIDGRILIAGSNPNEQPVWIADFNHPFPTEMRVEYYYPYYITGNYVTDRPTNVWTSSSTICACPEYFGVHFTAKPGAKTVMVTLTQPGFVTHGVHMGQKVVELETSGFKSGIIDQHLNVKGPPNSFAAPDGIYWLCVLVNGALNDVCVEITVLHEP